MIFQHSSVYFLRCTGKNAEQRVCVCGGMPDERGWHWAELECDCPLQTRGRGVAVQERPARGPVRRGDGLQTETAQLRACWLERNTQWTLGKNVKKNLLY